jgi:hypothetical protein
MKYSKNSVHNARREFEHKTDEREDRYIELGLKQNYPLPLPDVTNIIGLPISRWTVARRWAWVVTLLQRNQDYDQKTLKTDWNGRCDIKIGS